MIRKISNIILTSNPVKNKYLQFFFTLSSALKYAIIITRIEIIKIIMPIFFSFNEIKIIITNYFSQSNTKPIMETMPNNIPVYGAIFLGKKSSKNFLSSPNLRCMKDSGHSPRFIKSIIPSATNANMIKVIQGLDFSVRAK